MNAIERAAHLILSPTGNGNRLTASMRLVALTILLWEKDHEALTGGRRSMDLDFLSDRTGLSPEGLNDALNRLESVSLVRKHADGWRVTMEQFVKTARSEWSYRDRVRHVGHTATRTR